MHRGYNLIIDENEFDAYVSDGEDDHGNTKEQVASTLDSFLDGSGKLIASKITANWFPQIKRNIFISHSHNDAEMAIGLSGWLKYKFGLTSFIDSCVWGYSAKLQRMIDNEHCWTNARKEYYNYEKRNRSTAHVNMMLSVALTEMMNNCECIVFLNTPKSISSENYIRGNVTDSPWIYAEIAMTSMIQKRSPQQHRISSAVEALDEGLIINYDVDLSHLTDITQSDLDRWSRESQGVTGLDALDKLYIIK